MTGLTLAVVQLLAVIQAGLACYLYPMPPKILFPAERRIEVHPGATFTLKCQNVFRQRWEAPGNSTERISVVEDNLVKETVSIDLFESTFTRTNAQPEDSGYYHCVQLGQGLKENFTSDSIFVNVTGTPEENSAENIEERPLQKVYLSYQLIDNSLEITCSAQLVDGMPYHIYWQVPKTLSRRKDEINLELVPLEYKNGRKIVSRKLTVYRLSERSNGLYNCTLTDGVEKNSAALALSGLDVKLLDSQETSNDIPPQ